MKRNFRLANGWAAVAATLTLTLMLSVAASAQVGLSKISGFVYDDQKKPIANAVVVLDRVDVRSGKVTLKTNKSGFYVDATIQVGDYDVTAFMPDGKTQIYHQPSVHINFTELTMDIFQNMGGAKAKAAMTTTTPTMSQEDVDAILSGQKKAADEAEKVAFLNSLLAQNKQLREDGKFDEAIPKMEQATQIDPTRDVLWGNLAEDYVANKQYDKAIDAYQKELALQTVPAKQANTMVGLGNVYMAKGDSADANDQYNKAKALDPEVGKMAAYNAAVGLFNAGKMDEAVAALNDVITADPTNANAYYYKGLALLNKATMDPKTGKIVPPPGMVEALQKSIDLAPNSPNAAQAKDILAGIK